MNIRVDTFQSADSFIGIIIKKEKNYVIVSDGFERFYINTNDANIDFLDIVKIKGHITDVSLRRPIESTFDFKKYLRNSGVYRQIYINDYTMIFNNPINVAQIKYNILSQFNTKESYLLANLLLFGDGDYSNADFLKIKNLGLIYLISLSGVHYTFLYNCLELIFNKFLKKDRSKIATLIVMLPFLIINFSSISLIRIYLTKLIDLVVLKTKFKSDKLETKCLPYLVLLIGDKYLIYNLSIVIPLTLNIMLYFSSSVIKTRHNLKRQFYYKILFFFIMLPFYLQLNNMINILNYFATIVLIPISKALFLTLIPSLFMLKIPFLDIVYSGYFKFLTMLEFKYLNINGSPMNQYFIVIYYAIFLAFIYYKEINYKRVFRKIQGVYFVFLMVYFLPIKNALFCEINFINVGQGDSTLLRIKGENILIDTGGSIHTDIATNSLIPYLRKNKIYKLDKVFITHYDMDHYYALDSLKSNFIVDKIFDYNNFEPINYSMFSLYNMNKYIVDNVEENKKSLVLNVQIYDNNVLLMGDAPSSVELDIIKTYPNLRADILKVGHHGSDTSTCEQFIQTLKPREAVISCGEKNMYKHPHKDVLDILNKYNVKIRRTDKEGTITYKFFN